MGGASVGLVDDIGENALSVHIQTAEDIRSQAYSVKPQMMYNTMQSRMYEREADQLNSFNSQY